MLLPGHSASPIPLRAHGERARVMAAESLIAVVRRAVQCAVKSSMRYLEGKSTRLRYSPSRVI